jgi:hypothetical protein
LTPRVDFLTRSVKFQAINSEPIATDPVTAPKTRRRGTHKERPVATQTNIIEDGFERIQGAVENVNEEFQSIQKRITKQRNTFEKDARKRVKKFQADARKNDLVKRAEKFQKTVEKDVRKSDAFKNAQKFQKTANTRIEKAIDGVLSVFQIASSSDIAKLDRKLGQINRKLKVLEKARAIQPAKSL